MTTTAALYVLGCCSLAALSILVITWIAKHQQQPADRVSDKWLDDNIRERRLE